MPAPSALLRILLLFAMGWGGSAHAQVYDWSMVNGTQSIFVPEWPIYGPRNHIPAGNFNTATFGSSPSGFSGCVANHQVNWGPGATSFNNSGMRPVPLFNFDLDWPYAFRWICNFTVKYGAAHPANFYMGCIQVRFHEYTGSGARRYNYVMFELKQPLDVGVPYVFSGKLAAASINPTTSLAHLSEVGVALLHDLPVPDSSYALLDSVPTMLRTPANTLLGAPATTLSDTIIGNGERYLVVGIFDPIDSVATSNALALGGGYEYLLENFYLYRRDCNLANAQFYQPADESCREDTYRVRLDHYASVSPFRQWWLDGVFQTDSTDYEIHVPYTGQPETIVTAVVDTGACIDTASFTVLWRGVEPQMIDTFTVCGQPVVLDVDTILHHVDPYALDVDWTELSGPFAQYDLPDLDITLADSGTYAIRMDYHGCTQFDTLVVGPDRPLVDTTLWGDPALLPEVTPEHCVNMQDGAVQLHNMGYPGTLHFDWYDSPWAGIDTSRVDSLSAGTWHVRVRDDQYRCTESAHTIPQWLNLCAMIRGTIYEDLDLDCAQDSAETGHALRTVQALPVGNVAVTDTAGTYELLVPPGTHAVTAVYTDPWMGNNCGNGTVVSVLSPGAVADSVDIADTTHVPVTDLRLTYTLGTAWVTGTAASCYGVVRNAGELQASATLRIHLQHTSLVLDTVLLGATYAGMSGDTLLADVGLLEPGEERAVHVYCNVPPDPLLQGSVAYVHFAAVPLPDEADLTNNADSMDFELVGAYDPNDKLVSPVGEAPWQAVDTTVHRLHYTIRFQNTGSYPATTVRLEDELPAMLVPQSLQVLGASHAMQAFTFGNVLHFVFPSIMLPDSSADLEGSMGWVRFDLDVMPGAQYGDSIVNTAAIYFDQNPPVITPPAITRFLQPLSTSTDRPSSSAAPPRFRLVPNPAEQQVSIMALQPDLRIESIELLDARGMIVRGPLAADRLDLFSVAAGIYHVRIRTSDGVHVIPLVKH